MFILFKGSGVCFHTQHFLYWVKCALDTVEMKIIIKKKLKTQMTDTRQQQMSCSVCICSSIITAEEKHINISTVLTVGKELEEN